MQHINSTPSRDGLPVLLNIDMQQQGAQDYVVGQKKGKLKRPADPPVATYLDVAELESLMRAGLEEADAAIDGTGFIGGRINSAISNGVASLCFGILLVASGVNLASGGALLQFWSFLLPGGKAKATAWIYVSSLLIGLGCMPCAIRCFCLVRLKFRLSHISGCFLRVWLGFTQVLLGLGFAVVYANYSTVLCVAGLIESMLGMMFLYSGILSFERRFTEAQFIIEAFNFLLATNFLLISVGGETMGYFRWVTALLAAVFGAKFVADVRMKVHMSKIATSYIQTDYDKYKLKWASFVSVEANLKDLAMLQAEVAQCMIHVNDSGYFALTAGVRMTLQDISIAAGTDKPRQRFDSLPVLFHHAHKLNDYFQGICARWAAAPAASGGFSGDHHVCSVKRRDRAIQKLYRSYNRDATRIIDLVRSGITFERIEDLAACLSCIRRDPRVAILQVKNRLSLTFDDRQSAGYRNLALNLVLVDEETMRLGVDFHVTEVQLGFKLMDDLKNDDGHTNYVRFRNARAE
jgi:hypothetical protein